MNLAAHCTEGDRKYTVRERGWYSECAVKDFNRNRTVIGWTCNAPFPSPYTYMGTQLECSYNLKKRGYLDMGNILSTVSKLSFTDKIF